MIRKLSNVYSSWQEMIFRHMSAALNNPKARNSDINKLKSRYNFASINGGAKIIETRPSIKIGKSILDDAVDK